MPTGGNTGEYYALVRKYGNVATNTNSLQHNLSTPLLGSYSYNSAKDQGSIGDGGNVLILAWPFFEKISAKKLYTKINLEVNSKLVFECNYSRHE